MRKLILVLLAMPFAANADLIRYEIEFSSGGSGEFFWDTSTELVSNLTWDFGPGLSGGVINYPWASEIDGEDGTLSQFFFEIVTQIDVSSRDCTERTDGFCSQAFSSQYLFGNPNGAVQFTIDAELGMTYYWVNLGPGEQRGTFSTRAIVVPEPGTLALLVIGLIGMGLARRWRTQT